MDIGKTDPPGTKSRNSSSSNSVIASWIYFHLSTYELSMLLSLVIPVIMHYGTVADIISGVVFLKLRLIIIIELKENSSA